jgi:hypothetical protein
MALAALPTSVVPVMRLHSDVQQMIVEARLTGKKDLTRQALLLDPSVRDFDHGCRVYEERCQAGGSVRVEESCILTFDRGESIIAQSDLQPASLLPKPRPFGQHQPMLIEDPL